MFATLYFKRGTRAYRTFAHYGKVIQGVCVYGPQLKFYLLFRFLQNNYVNIAASFIGENGEINTAQSLAGSNAASQCLLCT